MHCGRAFASPWLRAGKQLSLALVPLSPQEVGRLAALHMYVQSTCTEHVCRGDATLRTLETPSLPSAHLPVRVSAAPRAGRTPHWSLSQSPTLQFVIEWPLFPSPHQAATQSSCIVTRGAVLARLDSIKALLRAREFFPLSWMRPKQMQVTTRRWREMEEVSA